MILDNYYGYYENSGITDDPATMFQAIVESSQEYNDLCMKMARLEHTAIMNEDNYLLREGISDFGKGVGEKIRALFNKFLEYCDRIYDAMQEIMIKVTRTLAFADKRNGVGKKVKLDDSISKFLETKQDIFSLNTQDLSKYLKSNAALIKKVKEELDDYLAAVKKNDKEFEASKEYDNAVRFTKDYTKMVRYLKSVRKEAKELMREAEKEARENEEGYGRETQITRLSNSYSSYEDIISICTKTLSFLRRGLTQSFKVIYTCGKVTSNVAGKYKKKDNNSSTRSSSNQGNRSTRSSSNQGNRSTRSSSNQGRPYYDGLGNPHYAGESYSILDQF